jgi:hypothetical protein
MTLFYLTIPISTGERVKPLKIFLLTLTVGGFSNAYANCEDVIRLSKTVESDIARRDDFESSAAAFCNEYKNTSSSTRSANYGLSYKFIKASMGTANASESEIASKVCSSNAGESHKKSAYDSYIEKISDKAYEAYKACVSLGSSNIGFTVNSILTKEITFTVRNSTNVSTPASMQVDSSSGVTCNWVNESGGLKLQLPTSSSALLKCTRSDTGTDAAITIINTSMVGQNSITVPWGAVNKDGIPIDLLAALNKNVDSAVKSLNDASAALKSSVVAFALNSCPDGWEDYKPAYGQFIRGLDKGTPKADPAGLRTIGSSQGDAFAAHIHNLTLAGASGNKAFVSRTPAWGYDDWHGAASTASTAPVGGEETRPKNVALLYCTRL